MLTTKKGLRAVLFIDEGEYILVPLKFYREYREASKEKGINFDALQKKFRRMEYEKNNKIQAH